LTSQKKIWFNKHQIKIRFLFVGGINTFFGLALYPVLYYFLQSYQIHYLLILILTQIISIFFSFITNKFLVFKTQKNFFSEFLKFSTFYVLYFIINVIFLPIAVELLHFNPVVAQTSFAFLIILSSYFWHNQITFFKKKKI
jgi:putative flippase GtrA